MKKILKLFNKQVAEGLSHHSLTKCSEYALKYRVMGQPIPGKWTFDFHPWLREMHDCNAELMVGKKSAQGGFTEVALNKAFFINDIHGLSVLYILPNTKPAAANFSSSRFDPALELSKHIGELYSDTKNIGHKRAGTASLFIRGSRSKADMKSDPAALMIFDEVEEMVQDNIPLAFERLSGQFFKQKYLLSTPTINDHGIDKYFKMTDQRHFFFRCPCCSRLTEFTYPECLVVVGDDPNGLEVLKSYYICKECKGTLKQEEKKSFLKDGIWVPTQENKTGVGYHINQMYSSTVTAAEMAIEVLKSSTDPRAETELYNSKLGQTHAVKGAQVSDDDLISCIGGHRMQTTADQTHVITMGVDVGTWLHIEIDKWKIPEGTNYFNAHEKAIPFVLCATKVKTFAELVDIIKSFHIHIGVIDANPERRKVEELISVYRCIYMCFYGNNAKGTETYKAKNETNAIGVDRTSWLDVSLGRFKSKKIVLPYDLSTEYKDHIKEPVRIYRQDPDGNQVATYLSVNADHYAHARNYAEIALNKFFEIGEFKDA